MTEQNKPNEETAKQEQAKQEQAKQEQAKQEQAKQEQAKQEQAEQKQKEAAGTEKTQVDKEAPVGGEEKEDIEKVKTISALAYLIFFLPLLTNPESKFGKFHANQALLLLITSLAISVVGSIIPLLGWFIIIPLGFIFCLVLFIKGIINAVNGKTERLPLIGGYDIIK